MKAYAIINDIEHRSKDQVVRNLISWLRGNMETVALSGFTPERIAAHKEILEYIDNLLQE